MVPERSFYLTYSFKGYESLAETRFGSSQVPPFVASCRHGKQKRTKARKKETEEAENLIAKTLSDPPHACSESRLRKPGNDTAAGHSALTFERIRAPHPSRLAKCGVFDSALVTRLVK
jgi:hypothetical protein